MTSILQAKPPRFLANASPKCWGVDPEVFFPHQGSDGHEAKAICRHCPVRPECRAWAIPIRDLAGVWGGLSEAERRHRRLLLRLAAEVTQ